MSDPLLKMLVELTTGFQNRSDGQFQQPVTLCVNGMLVSGHIISRRDFLLADPLSSELLEKADILSKQEPEVFGTPGEKQSDTSPDFIHLRDVEFWTPDCNEAIRAGFWRGPLAAISGFSFGKLGRDHDQEE